MHDGLFRQTETPELIENSGVYTFVLFYYQALACHLLGLGEMHYLEHGRRDIAELAALAELAGIADNNERNGVRRVRGEGLAVVAYHAVCVAVIRSDERYAALGSDEVNESADAGVDRLNSLDG